MRSSCGGTLRPPLKRRIASARVAFQRQRAREHRRGQQRLRERVARRSPTSRTRRPTSSGNACCSVSESTIPLSVAAACSSRLNERQNLLRSARPHARLMRAPNGVCRISCMPPPSSKKRSATSVRRSGPRRESPCRRARTRPPARRRRGRARSSRSSHAIALVVVALVDRGAHARRPRARARSCGRSPSPFQNGIDGGAPCASSTRTTPASTRRIIHEFVPSKKDVAGHALDREVFVERADDVALGFDDDVVVGGLGNRAAAGDRGDARAAARAQAAVDAIVVQVRPAAAARGRDAVGEHRERRSSKSRALEIAVRIGRAHRRVERVDFPLVLRAGGDDLLREDVERRVGNLERVERAAADRADQRRALEQLVARRREKTPFGLRADPVARAADALQRDRDRARRAELHDEIDRADVDAELERGGRDDRAQLAVLRRVSASKRSLARQAAVVRQHDAFAEPLVERERDALAHAARADEDQRRPMR